MESFREVLPNRGQLRGGARRLIGGVLLAQSVILGVQTANATFSDDRRPGEYVFQDGLENMRGNDTEELSNYGIINGFGLNVLAVGALAGVGGRMIRGRRNETEPAQNQAPVEPTQQ